MFKLIHPIDLLMPTSTVLVEVPITDKIRNSIKLDDDEKEQFLNLILYFTPSEIEELRMLV